MDNTDISKVRLLSPGRVFGMDGRTSLSRTTIWRMVRAGDFPKPIQVSPGRVAWVEAEVNDWLASRIRQSAAA